MKPMMEGYKVEYCEGLDKMAEPFREYLRNNCHPHTAVLITEDRVLVVEVAESIPFTN